MKKKLGSRSKAVIDLEAIQDAHDLEARSFQADTVKPLG